MVFALGSGNGMKCPAAGRARSRNFGAGPRKHKTPEQGCSLLGLNLPRTFESNRKNFARPIPPAALSGNTDSHGDRR